MGKKLKRRDDVKKRDARAIAEEMQIKLQKTKGKWTLIKDQKKQEWIGRKDSSV